MQSSHSRGLWIQLIGVALFVTSTGCGPDKPKGLSTPSGPVSPYAPLPSSDAGRPLVDPSPGHQIPGPRDAGAMTESCDSCSAISNASDDTVGSGGDSESSNTQPTSDGGVEGVSSDTTSEPAPAPDKWLEGAPLFSYEAIAEYRLRIQPEGIDALNADSSTYVAGTLDVVLADGTEHSLQDVGMRLKGQWGSARDLTEKAAFLLKMNEFVPDQKLLGLNKLALNNMVQDATMLREQLAYLLFREMGVAAPRTAYARVILNDELMGLYAAVEVVDNASFLDHWFGQDDGNLYEGAYGSDLEYDLVDTFDQDRGLDSAFADLYELSSALDGMIVPETFVTDVEPWIDLDGYARFAATELFLAHWDGYASTRNNYFLYRAPGAKWSFMPWGTDQTFGDTTFPVFEGGGRLQGMCTASLICRQKLKAAYEKLIVLADELNLQARVDDLETLIAAAAAEDPRKEYDTTFMQAGVEQLREFLSARPGAVQEQFVCLDPTTVDVDADGASGCGEDCDDGDPTRYPGAMESCNVVDDDCDGEIDESEECDSCVLTDRGLGGQYAFCFRPRTYAEAQRDCRDRDGDLVAIHSEEEQLELFATASSWEIGEWWIGLSDGATEGEFEWEDDSDLDFVNWGSDEPNNAGDNENCTHLSGGGSWNDIDCDTDFAYVCQLP
jgi:spore coat protein CotH